MTNPNSTEIIAIIDRSLGAVRSGGPVVDTTSAYLEALESDSV
jgi:hypothetical protein